MSPRRGERSPTSSARKKLSAYSWISLKKFSRRNDRFQRRLPHGLSLCQHPMAVLIPWFHSTAGGAGASTRSPDETASAWRSASDSERAGHRATVMRGAQRARWAPRDRRLLRVLELRRRLQRFLRRSRQDDLALLLLELAHRHRDLMLCDAEESADSDDRV